MISSSQRIFLYPALPNVFQATKGDQIASTLTVFSERKKASIGRKRL